MTRATVTKFVCDAADGSITYAPVGEMPPGWFEFRGADYCPSHTLEIQLDGVVQKEDKAVASSVGVAQAASADAVVEGIEVEPIGV